MKPAFDKASVIKTLRDGIEKGYWSLEDLDTPNEYTQYTFRERKKALIASLGTGFSEGLHMPKHRNLLREDTEEAVRVEVIDPKDLLPSIQQNEPTRKSIAPSEPY